MLENRFDFIYVLMVAPPAPPVATMDPDLNRSASPPLPPPPPQEPEPAVSLVPASYLEKGIYL